MKMKRLVLLVLALCLSLCLLAVTASAATVDSGTCGDNLTWTLDSDGTLTIEGTGPMDDYWTDEGPVDIPWKNYRTRDIKKVVLKKGVTTIGNKAFAGAYGLETVVLPNGLTRIGDDAFQAAWVKNVTIPSTVTYIGDWAFQGCRMTKVTIPASVTFIGERAFDGCSNVTAYNVASGNRYFAAVDGVLYDKAVTKLIQYPFGSTRTSYTLPDTVTTIGTCSLAEGSALKSITIGAGVTTIEEFAFSGNTALAAIHVNNQNPNYSSVNGVLLNKAGTLLLTVPAGYETNNGTFTVPAGVETIETESFRFCSFEKVVLSNTVKTVNDLAFTYMYSLKNIDLGRVEVLGNHIFQGCSAIERLTIPATVTKLGDRFFTDGEKLDTIVFLGDAPSVTGEYEWENTPFTDVTATAYYPAGNSTWTTEVMESYGGELTWSSYTPGETPWGEESVDAPAVKAANVAETGKIKLSWNKVDGAAKYQVYCSTKKNSGYSRLTTTSSRSYTYKAAKAGTKYYFYVIAVAGDGTESEKSNSVSRTCDLAQPEIKLSNVLASGKIKISWNRISGADGYQIYRATSKNGTYRRIKTVTGTSYTDTATTAGKTYYYKVRAIDDNTDANSVLSDIASGCCDLARPNVTGARNSKGKPVLKWSKISGSRSYRIYIYNASGKLMDTATTTGTSWTHKNAIKGRTYSYRVVAVHANSKANSAMSLADKVISR